MKHLNNTLLLLILLIAISYSSCQTDSTQAGPEATEQISKSVLMQAAELAKLTDSTELIIAADEVVQVLHQQHQIKTALPYKVLLTDPEWSDKVRTNKGVLISVQQLNPYRDKNIFPDVWYNAFSAMFDIRKKEAGNITCRGLLILGDKNGGGPYLRIKEPRVAYGNVADLLFAIDESMLNLDAMDQRNYLKWYGENAMGLGLLRNQ